MTRTLWTVTDYVTADARPVGGAEAYERLDHPMVDRDGVRDHERCCFSTLTTISPILPPSVRHGEHISTMQHAMGTEARARPGKSVCLPRAVCRTSTTPRPASRCGRHPPISPRADRCAPRREAASSRWLASGAGAGQPPAREALR